MDRTYLRCADTAKLIRKALKEAFPGIKFSVRSDTYAGGASIRVNWTDGPTQRDVDKIARTFSGATFDSMTDMKEYKRQTMNGQPVSFGADYVFCSRDITAGLIDRCSKVWEGLSGQEQCKLLNHVDWPRNAWATDREADYGKGLAMFSQFVTAKPSPTAESVQWLA